MYALLQWRKGSSFASDHIVVIVTLIIAAIVASRFGTSKRNSFPLVNPPTWFQPRAVKYFEFLKNGMAIFSQSRSQHTEKPFRMLTEQGEFIVLPSRFGNFIRNELGLDFRTCINEDFHGYLPGFEPFGFLNDKSQILQTVVRKQLTKQLNTVTQPLSTEATFATDLIFGNSSEWQEYPLKDSILDLVARLSSRVFLGDEICRNDEWLWLTKEYTILAMKAALKLQMLPRLLRPIVNMWDPDCRRLRVAIAHARQLITPIVEQRRKVTEQARASGKPVTSSNDAIDWAESEIGHNSYDPAKLQLTLSFAAIHTTTDLLSQTLRMLAMNPIYIEPLRKEIIEVLRAEGWTKSALYKMKLLDSAVKEAQRLKPNGLLMMRRYATKDTQLPEGVTIYKGERIAIDGSNVMNPAIHENPENFDIYRFKSMREEPGNENKAQLVSTSADHLVFGHGHFACPGRFFASNEVKLALCHLLLKYDWKLVPGTPTKPVVNGVSMSISNKLQVMVRRRKEEINLESLRF
ncbi:Dihydromonacolin L monooxygenase LovA 1 [Colletotrichum truncatum]|uniref:Dihydromonacolin L monooxygenase LovA 1 n=1 Tax=Colletotrichum truncatum TaxID=5467 RepID=A0ACC3ZG64_COLTU|nr:Dihydromonacolin L monooxygenase LovA 1 [Colletotrichum truncatum]KAF6802007.1 Dihydromonacolin L monooxygenase LovA 1 [Colletotrichum truncatum]